MKFLYYKLDEFITILEICLLLVINGLLKNNCLEAVILISEFMFIRTMLGAKHCKTRCKCFYATMTLMITIFLVLKINFIIAFITVFFCAVILSDRKIAKKSDMNILKEGFMYKAKGNTKYKLIDEYIKSYPDSEELKEFENRLKLYSDERTYAIYKIRFRQRDKNNESPSLENIEAKTGVKQRRIVEKLDNILLSFKVFCKTKENS